MNNVETNKRKLRRGGRNPFALKAVIIVVLIALLQIPTAMIKNIIRERNSLRDGAIEEVCSKWANSQSIVGPVLSVPVTYEIKEKVKQRDENGKETERTKVEIVNTLYHILPENLMITGEVNPKTLKRGIYEVVVYESTLSISGNFSWIEVEDEIEGFKSIDFSKAYLTFGVSDLRGLKEQIKPVWDGQKLEVESGSRISGLINSAVTVNLPDISKITEKDIDFKFDVDMQGSQRLSFVPLGKETITRLKSDWSSPSFSGAFLPDEREVNEKGFTAEWKILQLNRNIQQAWTGNFSSRKFEEAEFGVDLILPVDDYQKTMRSAKYGIMTIALTFLIFFLVEVINKQRIHPIQYSLVGLALCLFYVLLLSISEQINFNTAYAISTFGIVAMIALYSLSVFDLKRITGILILILTGVYTFLFVTLQLADYALLMGSIGLTVILGLTMYFTRNINWYQSEEDSFND